MVRHSDVHPGFLLMDDTLGVDVNGTVVIVRNGGGLFRGIKVIIIARVKRRSVS